jgi:hypothetical protein
MVKFVETSNKSSNANLNVVGNAHLDLVICAIAVFNCHNSVIYDNVSKTHAKSLNVSDQALTYEKLEEKLERVKGIEPSYSAWKAAALPLSYTRILRRLLTRS